MHPTKSTDNNPYTPPRDVGDHSAALPISPAEATRIREGRLQDEHRLKEKTLFLTGGFVLLSAVANLGAFGFLNGGTINGEITIIHYGLAAVTTFAAMLGVVANWGVRRFAAWSRAPLTMMAVIALIFIPIGTWMGGTLLITIYLGEQPRLLTKDYERIVKATPALSTRTSFMTWFAIVLLIVLGVSIFVIAQIPPEIRNMR